jgi:hypothetical protein
MIRVVTSVIAMIVMAMPAHALTAEEIQETSPRSFIYSRPRVTPWFDVATARPKVVASARPPVAERETPRPSPTLIDL